MLGRTKLNQMWKLLGLNLINVVLIYKEIAYITFTVERLELSELSLKTNVLGPIVLKICALCPCTLLQVRFNRFNSHRRSSSFV